ncbi:hypothetical protein PPERSA_04060 [Pseudocohnilembus persalinus]|uniref:Uncharacterized protein n=1 Tax=Pseudocohnilembus persalinus TaxID=266149 RepID=A0A0V0QKM8_PSEPJ|nr:hypothetical protein PPERSA_04060 [Pseudocohnilembus persalinus]|eukprot:KRX02857.1 hypothetical protein PPERSA_04060 [Pseudocohnilembus persalinus]
MISSLIYYNKEGMRNQLKKLKKWVSNNLFILKLMKCHCLIPKQWQDCSMTWVNQDTQLQIQVFQMIKYYQYSNKQIDKTQNLLSLCLLKQVNVTLLKIVLIYQQKIFNI